MNKNVLVFSIALGGYEKLYADCVESLRSYCERFQYDYVLINQVPRPLHPKESAWLKVPLILAALERGYDWVAFVDADCEIKPHTPGFVDELEKIPDRDIFMAHGKSKRINSGVLLVRNSKSSREWLQNIVANADRKMPAEDAKGVVYENGHLIHYGKNSPLVHLLEHRLWNNNSCVDEGSYIQHYSKGVMRDYYLQHRAVGRAAESAVKKPRPRATFVSKLWKKVKHLSGTDSAASPLVAESLKDLLVYYKKAYPAFTK